MFKYIFLVFLIVFTGCAPKQEYVDRKVYDGYSKDAILEATKRVFYLADENRKFQIDSYRNKVEVTKPTFYHHVFDVGLYEDTWTIETIQENNKTRVTLNLKRIEFLDEKKKITIHKKLNTDIFWNRVDYLLGINKTWPTCAQNISFFTNDGVICDMGELHAMDPTRGDMVEKPLISQRPKKVYSVDTIEADIYKFTDLTIKKNTSDIFEEPKDKISSETLDPILDDNILETEEKKEKTEEKIDEDGEIELQKLKEQMNEILESKKDIEDIKVEQIIEKQEIQVDSEFITEEEEINSSEDNLDKIQKKIKTSENKLDKIDEELKSSEDKLNKLDSLDKK